MRVIPTRVHGVLDYTIGLLRIVAPWLFDFHRGGAAMWIPVLLGFGAIGYSLFTDYELGTLRRIPMPLHLMLDLMSGVLLTVSPWLFGFVDSVWAPHLIVGLIQLGVTLTTWRTPASSEDGIPADASLY